jgi:chromosome segregation ATPase
MQIQALNEELARVANENRILEEKYNIETMSHLATVKNLNSMNIGLKQERDELALDLNSLQEIRETLENQNETVCQKLNIVEHQESELNCQLGTLRVDQENFLRNQHSQEGIFSEMKIDYNRVLDENDELREFAENIKRENEDFQSDNEQLTGQVEKYQEEIEDMQGEVIFGLEIFRYVIRITSLKSSRSIIPRWMMSRQSMIQRSRPGSPKKKFISRK